MPAHKMMASFEDYVDQIGALLRRVDAQEVQALVDVIADAYRDDCFVFIIGNGGSGANASHLCEDLGKGTLSDFENPLTSSSLKFFFQCSHAAAPFNILPP